MTSTVLRSTAAAIAFAGALALASPSMAAMMTFKASLDGKSEVPAKYRRRHRLGHRDL